MCCIEKNVFCVFVMTGPSTATDGNSQPGDSVYVMYIVKKDCILFLCSWDKEEQARYRP